MPDIVNAIVFNAELENLIRNKKSQTGFNHTSWSDNDLEPLRNSLRVFYRNEQNGFCAFCRQNVSLTSALNCHVEHIVPKSLHLDFIFIPKNICVICADCNQIKRDQETLGEIPDTVTSPTTRRQYPRASSSFEIVHPHFDIYDEHILVTNGYYIDRTPKGHFTIGACKLNRKLHVFGWEVSVISEAEISSTMNDFLDEKDAMQRLHLLTKLKKMLILS